MESVRRAVLAVCCAAVVAVGCTSLGEDTPFIILPDADVVLPTFQSVNERVFTPVCTCHAGDTPAAGMDLTRDAAYDSLIGVASMCDGSARVIPGDAAGSLIVKKLAARTEGSGVPCGDGMPASGEPLSQQTLDAIRTWIADGAHED